MLKYKHRRPQLKGRAAIKTAIKRHGVTVPRDFFGGACCIACTRGLYFRFRFRDGLVDVAEIEGFDRWSNSTLSTEPINCYVKSYKHLTN